MTSKYIYIYKYVYIFIILQNNDTIQIVMYLKITAGTFFQLKLYHLTFHFKLLIVNLLKCFKKTLLMYLPVLYCINIIIHLYWYFIPLNKKKFSIAL